jgi:hypothetical protein
MKIRKFNESKSDVIDPKYLNFIFDDFIDNGAVVDYDIETGDMYWEIFIKEPMIYGLKIKEGSIVGIKGSIDKYIESSESILNFSKTIKSCIQRVEDEFPNIKVELEIESQIDGNIVEREIHIIFTL